MVEKIIDGWNKTINSTKNSDSILSDVNNKVAHSMFILFANIREWGVSKYCFTSLSAIVRQKEPWSRDYALLLSNDMKCSLS